jgi:hypothetical protein
MLQAETSHRGHAIVEQVIADLKAGPLAHLPSGVFTANAAWLVLAAIAFNLTRSAGCLASAFHARDHRNPASPADQHRRPDRPARPTADAAPAPRPALDPGLQAAVHRGLPTTHTNPSLTAPPHRGPTATSQWNSRADRRTSHTRTTPPHRHAQRLRAITPSGNSPVDPGLVCA